MSINWQQVIATLVATVSGVLLGAAAWLIQKLVSDRLARDAEAFKIQLQASADLEIERTKAFFVRASRVHGKATGRSSLPEARESETADSYFQRACPEARPMLRFAVAAIWVWTPPTG